MSDFQAKAVTKVELMAKVIRADGTEEDLGTVAYHHKNPLRRALWRVFKIAT